MKVIEKEVEEIDFKRLFEIEYKKKQELHEAIYNYIGESYQYQDGKITPVSQLEEDKDIEELTDDDIYFYPECEDESKENFKNKINELIKEVNKLKNK